MKKKENNYLLKFRPRVGYLFLLPILLCVIDIILLSITIEKKLQLTLLCTINPITVFLIIYTSFYGRCSPIYIDEEKIFQKRHGKIYCWYFKDMISVKRSYMICLKYCPTIIITSNTCDIKLTFEAYVRTMKELLPLLKNEKVKDKLVEWENEIGWHPFKKD